MPRAKHIFSTLLVLVMFFSLIPMPIAAAENPQSDEVHTFYQVTKDVPSMLGDLDLDRDVDAYDLTLLARHVTGIELVSGVSIPNSDVNGDGTVDANDLTQHAQYVSGIITDWGESVILASGNCGAEGDNVMWVLSDTGSLKIFGSGAMMDYSDVNEAPWYINKSSIKSVIVENGVTTIGDYAFVACENLANATISGSVMVIGTYAFGACHNLATITFVGSAPSIEKEAFASIVANACYPTDDSTWTAEVLQNYGGTITWVSYTVGEGSGEDGNDPPDMTDKASIADLISSNPVK